MKVKKTSGEVLKLGTKTRTIDTSKSDKGGAEIPMTLDKECQGSIRYKSADPKAVVSNVYLSRDFAAKMPKNITVTIEG